MRHHNVNRKLKRVARLRKALIRGLANNLIRDMRIKTSLAKAKEMCPFVERLVSIGKKGTIASHRLIEARLGSAAGSKKMMGEIVSRFKERTGGYTRIIKLPPRKNDGSKRALIEFV